MVNKGLNRFCIILLFLISALSRLSAQEMLGLTGSNYAGINGLMINPACLINSRQYFEVNILTTGISLDNNYLYFAQGEYTFGSLFKKQYQSVDYGMSPDKITIYDHYTEDLKWVNQNLRITGPSLMWSYQRHGFAVTTAFRTMLSIHDVPFHVAKFSYEGVDYVPQQNIRYQANNFDITHLSWAEIGLSYSYMIYRKGTDQLSLGISAKKIMGFSALYLIGRQADYMVPDDSTLIAYNMDADLGIAVPMESNSTAVTLKPLFRGRGYGLDFGLVYQKNKTPKIKGRQGILPTLCGQTFDEYDYKIGLSLLDFGSIRFTQDADLLVFDNVPTVWPMINKTKWKTIHQAVSELSWHFYNDSTAAIKSHEFTMYLPTSLSAQFDYNIAGGFYVNSVFLNFLSLGKPKLYRPTQLAVVPRFESRFFEVNFPFSVYDLKYPRLGVSVRAFFLTVGTDRLGSYLGWRDFTGIDFYLSMKIYFNKGYCKRKKLARHCGNGEYQKFLR
ncbi:MAG: DUF5723 family protein [Bacteroidetes bacterium]|nr:DUF5723 family protein [Bacteroidota bacterium]